ncbi:tachylectin-related carbohydrate-binding protein [Saccharothrix saharensis]|uniref:tachylectin-related carbohydrate-binding protein n=1 Tax=Saccharothrix saharensis TaxID=571190 RepID=UPI00369EBAB0
MQAPQCVPSANVFTAMAGSPDFRLRKHNDAASGTTSWTGDAGIGWGWDNRFFAGANGYVFFIRDTGQLERYRWTDQGGWENGGTSKVLETNWTGWQHPTVHFRVTADSNNHIYAVGFDGNLVWHSYDDATQTMTRKQIATGWGKYDQVFAAGDGVLYARDPAVQNGTLYRFQYDFRTETWVQQEKNLGWGWNGYKQITSPGGDVIYGMWPGGEVWWYRYQPAEDTWANSAGGNWKERITTWTGVDEIAPAVDGCKLGDVAPDVECKPSANFFAAMNNNDFRIRKHSEPETGLSNWDSEAGIGGGWTTRFLSGANGYKFIIRTDGALDRLRWNGTGWDNNGISERIATGWTGWDDPHYHYRITVDSNNHFYAALANGQLERSVYDEAAKTWTKEIIDDGWGKYDQVFAAGDGVLYARDPALQSGTLYRFHYDWKSRRWLDYGTSYGWGWNGYKQIVSPGADIVYGFFPNGEVWWYRHDPVTRQSAPGAEGTGKEYIMTWPNAVEIAVDVDACKLKSPLTVTPPTVPAPSNERAQMAFNANTQRFEIAVVTDSGSLMRGYQSAAGTEFVEWQALSGYQTAAGRATLAQRQDGRFVTMARGTDAQVKAYTQDTVGGPAWTGPAAVNGLLSTSPVVVRGANNLLTAFAVDHQNKLWYAEEFDATRGFKPWRKVSSPGEYNMSPDFVVVPSGDGFEVAYRSTGNVIAVRKVVNGAFGPLRIANGLTGAGTPAAVVFADGKVQLVVRSSDNKLYTQKEGTSGFSAGWTDISGGMTFAGSPAALVNAHGIVETAVRGSDNLVYRGGQSVPGATTWRSWATNMDSSVVDPSFAAASGTEQRVFFRDGAGNYFLWQVTAYSSDSGAAMSTRSGAVAREVVTIKSTKGELTAEK